MVVRRAWEGLSWSERRQVLKAARAGKRHPDREIAGAAHRWAERVLAPSQKQVFGSLLLGGLIDLCLGSGSWTGMGIAERRAARRILKADRAAAERP